MLLVGEQQNILKLFKIKLVSSMEKCMLHKQTVSDPDLEIRRGGGGGGRGGGQSPKKNVFALRASV